MLLTLGATIIVLGVLIFVHELGHFMAAKAVGIGVPRFSIGLGPATPLSFTRGETEYVISWVPLGGYVKMATAEEAEGVSALEGGEVDASYPRDKLFENKPLWARVLVISAGVIMNMAFAWITFVVLAGAFGRTEDPTTTIAEIDTSVLPPSGAELADVPVGAMLLSVNGDSVASWEDIFRSFANPTSPSLELEFAPPTGTVTLPIDGLAMGERQQVMLAMRPLWIPEIERIAPNSAADEAGFEVGDVFVRAAGDSLRGGWVQLTRIIRANPQTSLEFEVLRAGQVVTLTAAPAANIVTDAETGVEETVGQLGVNVRTPQRRIRVGWGGAFVEGGRQVAASSGLILFTLRGLIFGDISPRELGGPVLIGQLSGETARLGIEAFLGFMALFSVNLAILNILPIPVLDGGHLVFLLIEGVRGRPLSLNARLRLSQIGLVVLFGIMGLALTNDLLRVLGG